MFCTKCGKDNKDDNRFCIECGAELKKPKGGPASVQNVFEDTAPAQAASPSETLNVFQTEGSGTNIAGGDDTSTTILSSFSQITLTDSIGNEYPVDSLPAVIGKGSKADVIIPGDESISRRHFRIHEYNDEQLAIEDLGSTNKTFLNGNVLEPEELVELNNGDTIKVGESEFTIAFGN